MASRLELTLKLSLPPALSVTPEHGLDTLEEELLKLGSSAGQPVELPFLPVRVNDGGSRRLWEGVLVRRELASGLLAAPFKTRPEVAVLQRGRDENTQGLLERLFPEMPKWQGALCTGLNDFDGPLAVQHQPTRLQLLAAFSAQVQRHCPDYAGWFAVNNDDCLWRLVGLAGGPRLTDKRWQDNLAGATCWPSAVNPEGRLVLQRTVAVRNDAEIGDLFSALSSVGWQNDVPGVLGGFFGDGEVDSDFIAGPCPVTYRETEYLAESVTFKWARAEEAKGNRKAHDFCIQLSLAAPTALSLPPPEPARTIVASFAQWQTEEDEQEVVLVKPDDPARWGLIGQGGRIAAGGTLRCHANLAGASAEKGLYVCYEPDDILNVLLTDGAIPLVLGGRQAFSVASEKVDGQAVGMHLRANTRVAFFGGEGVEVRGTAMQVGEEGKVLKATAASVVILDKAGVFSANEVNLANGGVVAQEKKVTLARKVEVR